MNVVVLYNKPADRFLTDPSHMEAEEDTEHSAIEVGKALQSKGANVTLVPVTEKTIESVVSTIKADLIFNLIEWTGVDTPLAMQAFDVLNRLNIPYTGATKQNYYDTCDKIITKRLCNRHGFPTAQWQSFVTGDEPIDDALVYPMLVKVSQEHSSVGIMMDSIAKDATSLQAIVKDRIDTYKQPVFAESLLTGREFQVTLLKRQEGVVMLPPAEIVYSKGTDVPLLTYESRWDEKHTDYKNSKVALARLDAQLEKVLRVMCVGAFEELGFRDYARFDIRCDASSQPYFLELNSNPGLGDDPDYGMTISYKAVGMTFADFIWEIVVSARRRSTE